MMQDQNLPNNQNHHFDSIFTQHFDLNLEKGNEKAGSKGCLKLNQVFKQTIKQTTSFGWVFNIKV